MSWVKDYSRYCRYCEERGKYKRLRYWDNDVSEIRCMVYYCKKCGDKYDSDSIQQNCASCDGVYLQDEMPEMCDECVAMICQDCVDNGECYRCFRCNDRLCSECAHFITHNNEDREACKKHYDLRKIRCKRWVNTHNAYIAHQCKHITGPNRKYCKQHRYQHRRRRYIKK